MKFKRGAIILKSPRFFIFCFILVFILIFFYNAFAEDFLNKDSEIFLINGKEGNFLRISWVGSGTLQDPFIVTNCTELQDINKNLSAHYKLGNNIDCSDTINWNSGQGFLPIGNSTNKFTGSFNGSNYNITNLYINRSSRSYVGLFGFANNANISNVGLINISVRGYSEVGGLAGKIAYSYVRNSFSTGRIYSITSNIGGLVGISDYSYLINTYSLTNVSIHYTSCALVDWDYNAGGLIGAADYSSQVINSYSISNVDGCFSVGGLIGYLSYDAIINNSYSLGESMKGHYYLGGLVGFSRGTISNSYSRGNSNGTDYVGGLIGYVESGTISNSYSTGNISGNSNVGGLMGYVSSGTISNSYSTGNISGNSNVGGLIGYVESFVTISNSYSTGNVGGTYNIGGLIGSIESGTISNSLWDITNSGRNNMCGYDSGNYCNNSYGKTTSQMKSITTFSSLGWSIFFSNIYLNEGYPYLAWQVNNSSYVWLISSVEIEFNYFPDNPGDLDPLNNVTFFVNVTSYRANLTDVILQVKNSSISWNDDSVLNFSYEEGEINLNVANLMFNFTPEYEQNFSFRFVVKDDVGDYFSREVNLSIFWDCSWSLITTGEGYDLGVIGAYNSIKNLGNITILNTGDSNYSGGCLINFARSPSGSGWVTGFLSGQELNILGFSAAYANDDFSEVNYRGLKYIHNGSPITNLSVYPKKNKTLEIYAAFPKASTILEENPSFTIASNVNDTLDGKNNITIKMKMIVTPGAYLENKIEEYPLNRIIDLREGNFTFKAYVRNVVNSEENPQNNTAYNVYFNWTIPEEIIDLFSYEKLILENLTLNTTDKNYINITLVLNKDNLKNLIPKSYTLQTYSYGYENSTGELRLINHKEGNLLIRNLSFEFRCPIYEEGLVTSDICKPKIINNPIFQSGGGGGGGGSDKTKIEKSEAQFELVIGKQKDFILPIKNKYPEPLINLKIYVSGINSEFIEIIPKEIKRIEGNSYYNLTIKIKSPAYFTEGNYTLKFRIEGLIQTNQTNYTYEETKFVSLYFLEISREEALNIIKNSEEMINHMKSLNLSTSEIIELFNLMIKSYNETKFSLLLDLNNKIKKNYAEAIEALKFKDELILLIEKAKINGIKVRETEKLFYLGKVAFERGAFREALERFKEAKLTYAAETKAEFNLYYYIKNNPLKSTFILLGFIFFSYSGSLLTRRVFLKRKLVLLRKEQVLLLQLMKTLQRECFELGKLSMDEYQVAMSQYESRLRETVEEEIKIETKLAHLGKVKALKKALNQERERLFSLLKKSQEKYLVKGELETKIYYNMISSYSKRLAEVEEQLAFLEAKEWLSKEGSFFKKIKNFFH